jgi:hypothetical protein
MRNCELMTRLSSGSRPSDAGVPSALATGASGFAVAPVSDATSCVRRPPPPERPTALLTDGPSRRPTLREIGCCAPRCAPCATSATASVGGGTVSTLLHRPHRTLDPDGYFATSNFALHAGQEMIFRDTVRRVRRQPCRENLSPLSGVPTLSPLVPVGT